MTQATSILSRALSQAREEWLRGDPTAWSRYTSCLASLEDHNRFQESKFTSMEATHRRGRWNPLSTPVSNR